MTQRGRDRFRDMVTHDEQREKLDRAQEVAVEGMPVKFSYERLEFLGDSILGAVVADAAFHRFPDLTKAA